MSSFDPAESHNPIAADLDTAQKFADSIPHGRELGIRVEAITPGRTQLILPYQERLIGNPETGVLHGGVITTLIDTASGCAVFSALPDLISIATLDLRIDYLKPATPRTACRADGYPRTRRMPGKFGRLTVCAPYPSHHHANPTPTPSKPKYMFLKHPFQRPLPISFHNK